MKTREQISNERMTQYAHARREQFQKERENYRASFVSKFVFYSKPCFYFLLLAAVITLPFALMAFYQNYFPWLGLPVYIGIGASLFFEGIRKLKKARMIFGNKEKFTSKEISEIYFYDPQDKPSQASWYSDSKWWK